ncbi:hypothetical protein Nmel_018492 [Mimus melanotis]
MPGPGVQCALHVTGFSSSGRSIRSSCIMVQAWCALTLILLLVALPAQNVEATPWQAQAVGPEYQDGREQSSVETSKVLHEILRELGMILGGVNRLSLNSAVSRRSTSAGNSGADPDAVLSRADTNAVDANSFQKYCIEGIVAVLGSVLLGMVLCCVLHVWRKRRK